MVKTQTVKIIRVKKDQVILKLIDGQKINWPREDESWQEGEELNLALYSSRNLLNEILNAEEEPSQNQKQE